MQVLRGLYERELITKREAKIMSAAIKDELLGDNIEEISRKRAKTLKTMMLELIDT